jgi:hypothetical protein
VYEDIDEVAVLIDGAPQVPTLALDLHDHLVEEPPIAAWSLAFLDTPGVLGAESFAPLSNRFIGNAYPTFSQEIFDISKTQGEPVIQPNGMRDDVGRNSVSAITGCFSHGRIFGYRLST